MQGVYHVRKKFKREYIMSGGNLSGVYHFYTYRVPLLDYKLVRIRQAWFYRI